MTTSRYAVRDSATMCGATCARMRRYPALTLMLVGIPIVFLLLFVYVFGGTLGAGLGGVRRPRRLRQLRRPGILLITIAGGARERRSRSRWT